jgi:23S rRNA (adenine2503-C2)-methyltransferase
MGTTELTTDSQTKDRACAALTGLDAEELAAVLDLRPFQGRQIFRWIHQKCVLDFDEMTNLSKGLRRTLSERFAVSETSFVEASGSPRSETTKVLLRLADCETVETVLLRDKERMTLCLSTQVGCPVKCSFCATGLSGYSRNLSPGEIIEQALYLLREEPAGKRTPNIVLMGMGEPLFNYDATMKSVRLLMNEEGLGIGARKITVSTSGEAEGIERFAEEGWQVRLSVSLHAANDELRDRLVPLNRRYNLARLMAAVRHYGYQVGRQLTFEWTLMDGVNDRDSDLEELVRLVADVKATVNLIPYNPVSGLEYRAPKRSRCETFRDGLSRAGVKATLRVERGQDIDAACGQLRRRHRETAPMKHL